MALPKDWKELLECFNSNSVEYVLVGAFAVMYHSIPRTTLDMDVLVYPSIENGERVVTALKQFGFESLGLSAQDFTAPAQCIQLGHQPFRIDILTAISGVSPEEIWEHRVTGNLEGVPVHFLGREQLIKNKKAVGRGKDKVDLEILESPT